MKIKKLEIPVLYEDEDMLVINKPAGIVVNRSETAGTTVQDWAVDKLGIGEATGELMQARGGLAHRLDKETSGCLLIAKNEESLKELMRQFKARETKKSYVALVHGWLEPNEGVIRLPIARDALCREKRKVNYEGKQAETRWQVIKLLTKEGGRYSLVRLWPKTGRTHQIRVHMKHLKHPLFADLMYLGKKAKADREILSRHFLHAERIEFKHPRSGERMVIKAKLPADLEKVLVDFDMV